MSLSQKTYQSAGLIFPAFVAIIALILSMMMDPYLAFIATSWVIFGLLGLSLDIVWGEAAS